MRSFDDFLKQKETDEFSTTRMFDEDQYDEALGDLVQRGWGVGPNKNWDLEEKIIEAVLEIF